MPVPQQNLIVTTTPTVSLALEPAHNAFYSLVTLSKADHLSGLGQWVTDTRQRMSQEELDQNRLLLTGFYFALQPLKSWPTFPAYIDYLADLPPQALVDRLLDMYARLASNDPNACLDMATPPPAIDRQAILASLENYLEFLYSIFAAEGVEEALETQAYALISDPPHLQQAIVSHLRHMWSTYLQAEWQRVRPMLQNAVDAFNEVDFSSMTRLEATSFITGKPLEEDVWEPTLQQASRLVFIPSAHIGPYLGRFSYDGTVRILFGARLPAGSHMLAPELSRAEIVVRLSALADDTRLSILKLVAENGELRSQEVMERLDLSQSAASRHLKQLTATGYLTARRCAGANCYQLRPERLEDTFQAINAFLLS